MLQDRQRESELVSLPLQIRTQIFLDLGPTLITSFHCNFQLKALSSNRLIEVGVRLWLQHMIGAVEHSPPITPGESIKSTPR